MAKKPEPPKDRRPPSRWSNVHIGSVLRYRGIDFRVTQVEHKTEAEDVPLIDNKVLRREIRHTIYLEAVFYE
jgi:hypothetical protein